MLPSIEAATAGVIAGAMERISGMFPSQKYELFRDIGTIHAASMGPGCFYPGNLTNWA